MKLRYGFTILSALTISACGGGGEPVAGIDGGGALPPVATTITTQGTITGFGSVIVNGVRYETSGAQITIDGESGTEADLSVGQVVVVAGTLDSGGATGTATSINFDDLVEGFIDAIDNAGNTLTVLGQTVLINGDTAFAPGISPGSIDGLAVGDLIEVSGFRDSSGNIVATFIDLEDNFDEFEVTGFAAGVDTAGFTFSIQNLVIDYSAALIEDFPNGQPEDGQLIEAKGTMLDGSGRLAATEIEFKGNDFDFDDGDEAEIEGLITRFVSPTDFDVAGIPVTTIGSTQFDDGTSADLALDVRVEVEGSFNANGVLVAREVDFRPQGKIRIEARVEAVDGNDITVLGLTVTANAGTEFDDQSDLDQRPFGVTDINVGDYVELRAFDSDGSLVATRVERDDDPGEVALRGPVDSVNDPDFTILGITVRTNAGTSFEDNDVPISSAAFFSTAMGRIVEADGQLVNGEIVADEVELEN